MIAADINNAIYALSNDVFWCDCGEGGCSFAKLLNECIGILIITRRTMRSGVRFSISRGWSTHGIQTYRKMYSFLSILNPMFEACAKDCCFHEECVVQVTPPVRWRNLYHAIQKLFGSFKGDAFFESVALFCYRFLNADFTRAAMVSSSSSSIP